MIRVALIGLGNIGLLFDEDISKDTSRSHAKAIWQRQHAFELKYAADPVEQRRSKLMGLFPNAACFSDWKSVAEKKDFDVLAICVPTSQHFECASAFFNHENLKKVVLEKPAFFSDEEYKKVPKIFSEKIVMNYVRRFPAEIRTLKQKIESCTFGEVKQARGFYSKGLQNNGSHLIDLINFLFGEKSYRDVKALGSVIDYSDTDPSISASFSITGTREIFPVSIVAGDEREFSVFELEITFSKARVRLTNFARKIEIEMVEEDPISPGYKALGPSSSKPTELPRAIGFLYDHIIEQIEGGSANLAPFSSELWNRALISDIIAVK